MTRSKHGFGDNLNDRERAQLRGKGKEPNRGNVSFEGSRMGEDLGLRGHTTGSQDTPRNEYLNQSHIVEDSQTPPNTR